MGRVWEGLNEESTVRQTFSHFRTFSKRGEGVALGKDV